MKKSRNFLFLLVWIDWKWKTFEVQILNYIARNGNGKHLNQQETFDCNWKTFERARKMKESVGTGNDEEEAKLVFRLKRSLNPAFIGHSSGMTMMGMRLQ